MFTSKQLLIDSIYFSDWWQYSYEDTFSIDTREGRWALKNLIAVHIHITNLKYKLPSCVIFWENEKYKWGIVP